MALAEDLMRANPHLTNYVHPTLDERWYSRLSWPGGEMVHRYSGSLTVTHLGEVLFHAGDFGWESFRRDLPLLRAALVSVGLQWPRKYDRESAWPESKWPPLWNGGGQT